MIDAAGVPGSSDRRNQTLTLQVIGADLVGSTRHNLLGGEDAVLNQPSDPMPRNAERCGGFRHRESVAVLPSETVGVDTVRLAHPIDTERGPGFSCPVRLPSGIPPGSMTLDILFRALGHYRTYHGSASSGVRQPCPPDFGLRTRPL